MIIEAVTEGLALVAGPSTISEMKKLISLIEKYNVSKILIDGALFRKSIASFKIADAAILSTGASYNPSMKKVVNDTTLLLDELTLPKAPESIIDSLHNEDKSIVIDKDNSKAVIELDTLLSNEEIVKKLLNSNTRYLYIAGALSNKLIHIIIDKRFELNKLTVIVKDATHIIVDIGYLEKLKLTNTKLCVINKINMLLLTYNPYSPHGYEFNNEEFKNLLKEKTKLPVINVLKDLEWYYE